MGDLCADGFHLSGNAVKALLTFRNLRGNGTCAAFLRLHLLTDAVSVFQIVLNVVLDQVDGVLALVGLSLHLCDFPTDGIRFDVFAAHLLGKGLGSSVQALHLLLRVFLLTNGILVVGQHLDGGCANLFQLLHPHGNFQRTQLIAQDQEFLCLFRLYTQGLHLQLQFVDLIVDTNQIFIGAGQLALSLLLAMAETGDTGSFLKDLAAVSRLDGQDLIDLALADDGVALTTQTGIHEQFVYVFQADAAAVDVILTLTGAIITAGNHHFALIQIEQMLCIVNDQRDLGKTQALSLFRAAKDNIFHLGSA